MACPRKALKNTEGWTCEIVAPLEFGECLHLRDSSVSLSLRVVRGHRFLRARRSSRDGLPAITGGTPVIRFHQRFRSSPSYHLSELTGRMKEPDDEPRVGWASRLPCDASCVAPGGRQLVNELRSTPGCIPRDAKDGRRDAHPTRDTRSCSLSVDS